ncbi:hypothetical protein ACFL4P_00625 [Gemmatimonadota bacterium]
MESEKDENQLDLWKKLNRLYGENETLERENVELDIQSSEEETSDDSKQISARHPNLSGATDSVNSVNSVCGECDQSCKQPESKFVEILCPLSPQERSKHSGRRPKVSSRTRPVPNLDKTNRTCLGCHRSCKQSTEKLNIMLCPGMEPVD